MELLTTSEYNQGIGKNKLLSSTAGVGAIITTKIGYYVLISDVNKWEFVKKADVTMLEIQTEEKEIGKWYDKARVRFQNQGISIVDDRRFVEFLKSEKELPLLTCLVSIPSIALNEQFNTPNWKNHPINKKLGETAKAEDFMVKGTHFPKWFINDQGLLKTYGEWKDIWQKKGLGRDRFVPPRDANKPILDKSGNIRTIVKKNDREGEVRYPLYTPLTQSNLILICPNGHLSDIPWAKFLKWKSQRRDKDDTGSNLLFESADKCCSSPQLKWTESKTKSEGYSSVYIECLNCGCGSGEFKVNLEGINNFKPLCAGHKPWQVELTEDSSSRTPFEDCFCTNGPSGRRESMQVALVTGNNVYYASVFSSLFIPDRLASGKSHVQVEAQVKCAERYAKYLNRIPGLTKTEFWVQKMNEEDFLIENGFEVVDKDAFFAQLKADFLGTTDNSNIDPHEEYRWQEYRCFTMNSNESTEEGLRFSDIRMPVPLKKYFRKIQQVEELKVTNVQLDFTRVKPKERIRVGNKIETSVKGQNVYSKLDNELFILPANEIYGEGLFFQFDDHTISEWIETNSEILHLRFKNFLREVDFETQGATTKHRIKQNWSKHFLIHTFSHALMRELEFSCGYPTASLKERLYISERMNGVLIYTAEGSEGSMGGIVWQGQPERILELISKALERTFSCSSDPLCWESDGQGIFDLNLAACFSCSLVSETACEERNLGLDRRVLVDAKFGYFKNGIECSLLELTSDLIEKQLGSELKWRQINEEIVKRIEQNKLQTIGLADVSELSERTEIDIADMLSVIGLLSSPDEGCLMVQFNNSESGAQIPSEVVYVKLKEFWRDKTIPNEVWESWASSITVKWQLKEIDYVKGYFERIH